MQIQLIKPGLLSTVQDMGRPHFREQAVPVSGAMDALSARMANMALGNDTEAAVIEFTYAGAVFKTTRDILLAWAGDGARLMADEGALPAGRPVFVPANTTISLLNNPAGSRTYLAVAGGWDVPVVLGSRSTYLTAGFGGLNGRVLQAGDVLNNLPNLSPLTNKMLRALNGAEMKYPGWALSNIPFLPVNRRLIRVVPGPEFSWFTPSSIIDFISSPYHLSAQSNRMGYRLEGPVMSRRVPGELLSTAVTPGTIQVTNNNDLILLMADCQTTGGYPRIGQVAAVDLPLCAQLKPGDELFFKEIGHREATRLFVEREEQLKHLAGAVSYKY